MTLRHVVGLVILLLGGTNPLPSAEVPGFIKAMGGWTAWSPRSEIRPLFRYESSSGPEGGPAYIIEADQRAGLDGAWGRVFPVSAGEYYRIQVLYRLDGNCLPRRSVVVKLDWQNGEGEPVPLSEPRVSGYLEKFSALAETEFPPITGTNAQGWVEMSGLYRAPQQAVQARVRLHLQWAPNTQVRFGGASLERVEAPPARKVRLATIHYRPHGGLVPQDNLAQYAPLIANAAQKGAQLVVLGETINYVGLGKRPDEVAEVIPGPSTEYLGELARQHGLYLVAGLFERAEHLVYNTAVLCGTNGQVVGKYRKVCLPRSEVTDGVCPGSEYPVFNTPMGKVGMMICYDGFFPEVARELAKNGAEIIAWPVWGCNPVLARARACENHVYLVSSTYEDLASNWALSAVYNPAGDPIAHARDWGSVAVVEVDLNRRTLWPSLGDFRAQLPSHRPVIMPERP